MRPPITTDSHWSPPVELADELPERYRKFVPHLERRSDGDHRQPNWKPLCAEAPTDSRQQAQSTAGF